VIRAVAGRGNQYDIFRAETEAPAVMAAIRAYDPALLVGWDSSACRWSLLRVSRGGYHFVGVIETGTHEYRPLDMSVLEDLARWDTWKGAKSANEFVKQVEDEEEAHEAKVARDFRDDLRHATRDNRRTLGRLKSLAGL
jgi:hypothetical protein